MIDQQLTGAQRAVLELLADRGGPVSLTQASRGRWRIGLGRGAHTCNLKTLQQLHGRGLITDGEQDNDWWGDTLWITDAGHAALEETT